MHISCQMVPVAVGVTCNITIHLVKQTIFSSPITKIRAPTFEVKYVSAYTIRIRFALIELDLHLLNCILSYHIMIIIKYFHDFIATITRAWLARNRCFSQLKVRVRRIAKSLQDSAHKKFYLVETSSLFSLTRDPGP